MPAFVSALAICVLVSWGLGGWLRVERIGHRLAGGVALLIIAMTGLNFVLGLALVPSAWVVAVLAAGSVAFRPRAAVAGLAAHPVLWLPLLVIAVTLGRGGLHYLPYSWDEFSAWLYWPREAFLRNSGVEAADWRSLGYTQGLVLASLFPNLFFENFEEARLLALPVTMHVALMAVIHDVVARRSGSARLAWVVVLALLGGEAAWTLVPQLIQSEKPQVYLYALLILLLAEAEADSDAFGAHARVAGLILAAGFLVKSAFMAAFIPAILAWSWLALGRRPRDWAGLAQAVLPALAAVLLWGAFKGGVRGGCLGNPLAIVGASEAVHRTALAMASHLLAGIGDYVASYKPWLTIPALAGVVLALRGRQRVAMPAFAAMVLIYLASLYFVYGVCLNPAEGAALASLPRYLRVPLRTLHLVGTTLLALESWACVQPRLVGRWRRAAMQLLAGALVVLALWQVRAVSRALDNVETRRLERDGGALQMRMDREAEAVARLLPAGKRPWVTILAQGSSGEEFTYGRYFAMGRRRGDAVNRYDVAHEFSFAATQATQWSTVIPAQAARERLAAADALWLVRPLDSWLAEVLRPLMADPRCLEAADGVLMLHGADGRFVCRSLSVD